MLMVANLTLIVAAALVGIVQGLKYGFWIGVGSAFAIWGGISVLLGAMTESMSSPPPPPDISSAASPQAALKRERKAAIVRRAGPAVAVGTLVGVITGITSGVAAGVAAGVVAGVGLVVLNSVRAAWTAYGIARIWLALGHRLPWSLMGFLEDAHKRGVLRQAGAVYQFRHIELQHRLATRPSDSTSIS
jgi:hypothetical protein